MSRLHTQDSEWGYLMKLQADRIRQEELELKRDQEMRRRQYKEQLEQMIALSNSRNRVDKEQDVQLMKIIDRNNQAKEENEREHSMKLNKIKADFARENLRTKEQHIRRQIEERHRENKLFQENYKKQLEDAKRNEQLEHQARRRQKTELAYAYENKIHDNQFSRQRHKQEDAQYSEQNIRLEHDKDRQRRETLDKIKYGYQQNPETFHIYSELLKKKDQDKQNILTKYLKEQHPTDYEELERTLFAKDPRANNSGNVTRQTTPMAQIEKDLEDVKIRRLSEKLSEEEADRLREVEKKLQFRRILQQQIDQRQQQRVNERRMDSNETRLNKQAFTGQLMLPGFSTNDHQRQRQRAILNNSMGVRGRLKTLEEIRPSQQDLYNVQPRH